MYVTLVALQYICILATVEAQATHLLNELETRGLALTTPTGEPTWKRGTQESTINLIFIQETLADRLEFCGPEDI